jgi:hypothetical protein
MGKVVKFRAMKTVTRPVRVRFINNQGKIVSFNAVRTVKIPVTVRFVRKKSRR